MKLTKKPIKTKKFESPFNVPAEKTGLILLMLELINIRQKQGWLLLAFLISLQIVVVSRNIMFFLLSILIIAFFTKNMLISSMLSAKIRILKWQSRQKA